MREVTGYSPHHVEVTEEEDGVLYVNKIFNNKKALEQNKAMRNMNIMRNGHLGLHDNADIRMGLSVPSNLEWELFKSKNPDIYQDLKSKHETDRMNACMRIAMLEPEWVVQTRL